MGDEPPFPDLMTRFVKERSRNELIARFLSHLLYKRSFLRLADQVSEFHRRLSENPFLRELISLDPPTG